MTDIKKHIVHWNGLLLICLVLLLVACGGSEEPATTAPAQQEEVQSPTEVPEDTPTPVPPTNTPEPPTATPVPPTDTPEPVDASWEDFVTEQFGFSMRVPTTPEESTKPAELGVTTMYTVLDGNRLYAAAHTPLFAEIEDATADVLVEALQITLDEQLKNLEGELVNQVDLPLQGFPGQRVTIENEDFRFICWNIIAGSNLYQTTIVLDKGEELSEEDNAFLESFKLLDELPVTEVSTEAAGAASSSGSSDYALGDTISFDNLNVIVHSIAPYEGDTGFLPPEEGHQYVVIDLSAENVGSDKDFFLAFTQTWLQDSAGQTYEYDIGISALMDEGVAYDGEIPAGETHRGLIPFEVPLDARGLVLVVDTTSFADGGEVIVNLGQ